MRALHEAGLDERLTAIQAHGYKELIGYLRGDDFAEAVRITKRNTRHYARRQFSWMRGEPECTCSTPRVPGVVATDATRIIRAESDPHLLPAQPSPSSRFAPDRQGTRQTGMSARRASLERGMG